MSLISEFVLLREHPPKYIVNTIVKCTILVLHQNIGYICFFVFSQDKKQKKYDNLR